MESSAIRRTSAVERCVCLSRLTDIAKRCVAKRLLYQQSRASRDIITISQSCDRNTNRPRYSELVALNQRDCRQSTHPAGTCWKERRPDSHLNIHRPQSANNYSLTLKVRNPSSHRHINNPSTLLSSVVGLVVVRGSEGGIWGKVKKRHQLLFRFCVDNTWTSSGKANSFQNIYDPPVSCPSPFALIPLRVLLGRSMGCWFGIHTVSSEEQTTCVWRRWWRV